MDTSLSLPNVAVASPATAPVLERSITTKVSKIEASDRPATLPSDTPFIAQVVTARLSGSDYPENPKEITPQDRTLRPYDVPMLPYERDVDAKTAPAQVDKSPAVDAG